MRSRVNSLQETRTQMVVDGRPWVRISGTLTGVVDLQENIRGIEDLEVGDSALPYTVEFEILEDPTAPREIVIVEIENRGTPILLFSLHGFALSTAVTSPAQVNYPPSLNPGTLSEAGAAYARVQWQASLAPDIPATAQGVGEAIVRDFGRMLRGHTPRPIGGEKLGVYDHAILAGVSQSSWFATAFVTEGFNADPSNNSTVFDAVVCIDGVGNLLAINSVADNVEQHPYALPDRAPLRYEEILTRPSSDPLFIDVAAYTDYYRLRASVTAAGARPSNVRRYDWPAPHASAQAGTAMVFGALTCNGGVVVPLNPIDYTPYLRSLVGFIVEAVRNQTDEKLPDSVTFELGPAPSLSAEFNALAETPLQVPLTDRAGHPIGGVRFPDATVPLGRPSPVALPPVAFQRISDICGNWGGWQPFSPAELVRLYSDAESYLERYAGALEQQVKAGYLIQSEIPGMMSHARRAAITAFRA